MMRSKYGLTIDAYDAMIKEQHGVCAICGQPPQQQGFHIDHDHKAGAVRGLLCKKCNAGLGFFQDNPATLQSAIYYLALHGET